MSAMNYTRDEMMTIAASRMLWNGCVCFVGIGLPSAAANLARLTHAPEIVLVYESGTIGTKPGVLPLSIGDEDLATTADCLVSIPEIFTYWLQAGRVHVGFLGAAQIDRFGNLNTTAIGDYHKPKIRLPGAGGAPEIAAHARETFIMLRQSPRSFVDKLDFTTSAGYIGNTLARRQAGARGKGPSIVITDLGILTPDGESGELTLTHLFEGISAADAEAATGWPLATAQTVEQVPPPKEEELDALRDLHARTEKAHKRARTLPY
jgi:glutaconate CoA-transferase subunit B